jgi:hypothetical protein
MSKKSGMALILIFTSNYILQSPGGGPPKLLIDDLYKHLK